MKSLSDYSKEELNELENDMNGFIHGFGFKGATSYSNLVVLVKAKMEAEECDYLPRKKPDTTIEVAKAKLEEAQKEYTRRREEVAAFFRPAYEVCMLNNDFEGAKNSLRGMPDIVEKTLMFRSIIIKEEQSKSEISD